MERALLERIGDASVKDKGPRLSAGSLSTLMAIGIYAQTLGTEQSILECPLYRNWLGPHTSQVFFMPIYFLVF